jgi:ankyrin repeat protein
MERTEQEMQISENTTKNQEESEGEEMTYGEYFILSARQGDLDAVKECLSEEVPIDYIEQKTGNTALHMSAANNWLEIVSYLMAQGA